MLNCYNKVVKTISTLAQTISDSLSNPFQMIETNQNVRRSSPVYVKRSPETKILIVFLESCLASLRP